MSYDSYPFQWISDYHFAKAMEYRIHNEVSASIEMATRSPLRSLLLWGGADSAGRPYLEPVFVLDAPPALPDRDGAWTLKGQDTAGRLLFTLPFDMPAIADGGDMLGGFAFVLPVRSGWESLASITLAGPGGSVTLDGSSARPLSIWRDSNGQLRGLVYGDPVQADGGEPGELMGLDLQVLTSRGIPSQAAWRR